MSSFDLSTVFWILSLIAAVGCVAGLAMHRTMLWRSGLTIAVLGFAAYGLYPPANKLNPGLDLAGGTSLLYEIDTSGSTHPSEAIRQTIEVLKKRVDPTGQRQLLWREEQGGRIEIQMPLPGKAVRDTGRALRDLEKELEKVELPDRRIAAVVAMEGEQRAAGLAALTQPLVDLAGEYRQWAAEAEADEARAALTDVANSLDKLATERSALLDKLVIAQQSLTAVQEQFDAAAAARDEDKQIELAPRVNAAQAAYDDALAGVQTTNLSVMALRQVAARPNERAKGDDKSPRERGYEKLLADYPLLAPLINDYRARHEAYDAVKGKLDDPADLIRLLRDAGVLEFRMVVAPDTTTVDIAGARKQLAEQGPGAFANRNVKWVVIDDIDKFTDKRSEAEAVRANPEAYLASKYGLVGARYGADIYVLVWNTPELTIADFPEHEGWSVDRASSQYGSNGFPAIGVRLNSIGAREMRRLSAANRGKVMSVILDDVFISSATIQGTFGANFEITRGGGFSPERSEYMVSMLNAGSLQAKLSPEPIAIRTIGSNIGEDNLHKGLEASIDAMTAVIVFMLIYYFFAGAVANVALLANVVIILGVMAMYKAAFTMPGIAGIVLTIGMCVDANVLIFERIREELNRGTELDTAMRLGYERALSSIVDSNITNLIVCFILYQTATVEVRGFALTLGIGICATLFTALFVTRTIFMIWHKLIGINSLAMLPTVVPAVDRALTPHVRWLAKKSLFFTLSGLLVGGSIIAVVERGSELLDIEFRAGTEVEFNLAEGHAMTLQQARDRNTMIADAYTGADGADAALGETLRRHVNERVDTIVADARRKAETTDALDGFDEAAVRQAALAAANLDLLRDATVVSVGDPVGQVESADGKTVQTYSGFSVVSLVEDAPTVSSAIKEAFGDVMDVQASLDFAGADITDAAEAPFYAIRSGRLGDVINRPSDADVTEYKGGVAVLIDQIRPAATLEDIESRLAAMRLQPDFEGLSYPSTELVGLTHATDDPLKFTAVVLVSKEPTVSVFTDVAQWSVFAGNEWSLVRAAMSRDKSLSKVSNFTPTVAETLKQQAIVAVLLSLLAIVVYIWFRFGSLRFGLAAIAALAHDVTIALGAVSVCHYLYPRVGHIMLIEPFKINLAMIAALLTIIGYSLNDTIVLFDRIRENRGKLATATPAIIDTSINQTISRTLLTSVTTLLAVGTLYIFGGEGVRGFAFCLLIGVFVGTYSSIAIASPLLMVGTGGKGPATTGDEDEAASTRADADPAEPAATA